VVITAVAEDLVVEAVASEEVDLADLADSVVAVVAAVVPAAHGNYNKYAVAFKPYNFNYCIIRAYAPK
jgi:hypothetical protein